MNLRLPASIASSQDVSTLLIELQNYARWFAHESIKKRVDAKHSSPSPVMSTEAVEILREWKVKNQITRQSLDSLLKNLEDYGKTAPTITVTLAGVPSSSLKNALVKWLRENIKSDILVTFKFNATLLGGMVVNTKNRVFDWSFRRQILANREKFPEVLRRV